ncbi:MAG: DUF6768 family protein [Phycisphaerales bacterium]|jgi:hypothetical protein
MNTFDDDMRGAMQGGSGDSSLQNAGDEGLIAQVASTFHGRMRLWVVINWVGVLFWTCVAAWAGFAFFRATDTRSWIMYAAIVLLAGVAIAMLKLWYLMELNRNTHSREIKRVELQLARLAEGRPQG